MKRILFAALAVVLALPTVSFANEGNIETEKDNVLKVSLSEDGNLNGQVFVSVEGEKTPLFGKVSITKDGEFVAIQQTDADGNFAFEDIKPGIYTAIGVSGEYVGDQVFEVTSFTKGGEYTALPVAVAQDSGFFNSYGSAPLQTFSSSSYLPGSGTYGSCSGGGGRIFSGGVARGGSSRLRRLLLIGGVVGIAVGTSDDAASPDE